MSIASENDTFPQEVREILEQLWSQVPERVRADADGDAANADAADLASACGGGAYTGRYTCTFTIAGNKISLAGSTAFSFPAMTLDFRGMLYAWDAAAGSSAGFMETRISPAALRGRKLWADIVGEPETSPEYEQFRATLYDGPACAGLMVGKLSGVHSTLHVTGDVVFS